MDNSVSRVQGTFERAAIPGTLLDSALTTTFLSGPGSIATATYVLPEGGTYDLSNPVFPDVSSWVGVSPAVDP